MMDDLFNDYITCNLCGISKKKSEYYSLKFSGKCKLCCDDKTMEKKRLKKITYRNQKSYEILMKILKSHPELLKEYDIDNFIHIK